MTNTTKSRNTVSSPLLTRSVCLARFDMQATNWSREVREFNPMAAISHQLDLGTLGPPRTAHGPGSNFPMFTRADGFNDTIFLYS